MPYTFGRDFPRHLPSIYSNGWELACERLKINRFFCERRLVMVQLQQKMREAGPTSAHNYIELREVVGPSTLFMDKHHFVLIGQDM